MSVPEARHRELIVMSISFGILIGYVTAVAPSGGFTLILPSLLVILPVLLLKPSSLIWISIPLLMFWYCIPGEVRLLEGTAFSLNTQGLLNLVLLAGAFWFILNSFSRVRNIVRNSSFKIYILFIFYTIFNFLWSNYPDLAIRSLLHLTIPPALSLVCIAYICHVDDEVKKKKRRDALETYFLLFSTFVIVHGLVELVLEFEPIYAGSYKKTFLTGVFGHRGSYGYFLVLVFLVSLRRFFIKRGNQAWVLILLAGCGLLILFNNTRITWISAFVSIMTLAFLEKKYKYMVFGMIVAVVLLISLPNLSTRVGNVYDLKTWYFDSLQAKTLRQRVELWGLTLQNLKGPVLLFIGHGGGFVDHLYSTSPAYLQNVASPHNEYVSMLADYGIMGLALYFGTYLGFLLTFVKKTKLFTSRADTTYYSLGASVIIAFLILASTANIVGHFPIAFFYWFFIALVQSIKHKGSGQLRLSTSS